MNDRLFLELKREIREIVDRHPKISADNAFLVWFLRAFIVEDETAALGALKGGARDKGVDAVFIDHDSRAVFLLQGKYRQGSAAPAEKRADVIALADLGRTLLNDKVEPFKALLQNADVAVAQALEEARSAIRRRGYRLNLQFVTTGTVSGTHRDEAEQSVEDWRTASFGAFSRRDLLRLMQDYIEGAAPPVPSVILSISSDEVFKRYDERTGITSWIFSMAGSDIGKIFNEIGIRLFARNIRGFLGANTSVNRGMQATLTKEPQYFWYFNNGVTMVCDEARQISRGKTNQLRITNAQIINGQQTTRSLALYNGTEAKVLVKLVEIPRDSHDGNSKFGHVVSEIVSATNWQNAISQSDLKANDIEQVRIEREFRKLNYQYLRKKVSKAEARRVSGGRYGWVIKKEDLARPVGACALDPYEVRLGKHRLFEDDVYHKIFDGRPAADYLTLYWLDRAVSSRARTDSRRGYARLIVMNFIWSHLHPTFRRAELREKFRHASERQKYYQRELSILHRLTDSVFVAALAFYRANKRRDGKLLDESSFFKHKGLHHDFAKFWAKQDRHAQSMFAKRCESLINSLQSIEL
jgi:hypothetical protein